MTEPIAQQPWMILAALKRERDVFDPLVLITSLQQATQKDWGVKKVSSFQRAVELFDSEPRWVNLRIFIVDQPALHELFEPGKSHSGALVPLVQLKEHQWNHPLSVIGISTNDMFGNLMYGMGCDLTCDPDDLLETILHAINSR